MVPRFGLDGRKISLPPGFDPGPSPVELVGTHICSKWADKQQKFWKIQISCISASSCLDILLQSAVSCICYDSQQLGQSVKELRGSS